MATWRDVHVVKLQCFEAFHETCNILIVMWCGVTCWSPTVRWSTVAHVRAFSAHVMLYEETHQPPRTKPPIGHNLTVNVKYSKWVTKNTQCTVPILSSLYSILVCTNTQYLLKMSSLLILTTQKILKVSTLKILSGSVTYSRRVCKLLKVSSYMSTYTY